MELRSHSSVSCHLVPIHGTPTPDEGNVVQIYYRLATLHQNIALLDARISVEALYWPTKTCLSQARCLYLSKVIQNI
jgi:hypothetical protein